MEDEINQIIVFTHSDMNYLISVRDLLYEMTELAVALYHFSGNNSRSLLPDVIPFLQCSNLLIVANEFFLLRGSEVDNHLLRFSHSAPSNRIKISFYQVERELEHSLVMLLLLVLEVLAYLEHSS